MGLKIGDAPNGENASPTGTEKLPLTGSKWIYISTIRTFVKSLTDTLYSAFNHTHSDSDNGGVVNHTVLTGAGTSLHVPTYSSDSTQYLDGEGNWVQPNHVALVNAGTSLHVPAYSSDSTSYLNGKGEWTIPAGTGNVYDSDILFTDNTVNNADSDSHGFLLKLSMDTAKYLRADGSWQSPPAGGTVYDSDIVFTDNTTNNASTSNHGFLPKLNGDSNTYLNGDGEYTTPTGGSGVVFYDRQWVRGNTADSDDDEFNDGSIAAAWSRVDNTGHSGYVTWTEAADSLSLLLANTADAAAELHAYMKPRALNIGDTIQCYLKSGGAYSDYPVAGILIANGITYGAGVQAVFALMQASSAKHNLMGANWANYSTRSSFTDHLATGFGEEMHLRLKYSEANTFQCYFSPDGITWVLIDTRTVTMTPSHIGIFGSSYGSSTKFIFSFDNFRVNAP